MLYEVITNNKMSLLDNPLIKNLIKSKLPEVLQNLDSVESGLVAYRNNFV